MIVMPTMSDAQAASWHGIMDLHDRLDYGWTLVGGQMVHLHCAEHHYNPPRPTDDADTVIDVRAEPNMLKTFTETLVNLGFNASGSSPDGAQHRWVRAAASLDVLLPDGIGERATARTGVTGSPTIPTSGGTQALNRSESVAVTVVGRQGFVRRPNIVGALVMKAAAHTVVGDSVKGRHRFDFVALAACLTARDFREEQLSNKDRGRLRNMLKAVRDDNRVMESKDSAEALDRLERAAKLR